MRLVVDSAAWTGRFRKPKYGDYCSGTWLGRSSGRRETRQGIYTGRIGKYAALHGELGIYDVLADSLVVVDEFEWAPSTREFVRTMQRALTL